MKKILSVLLATVMLLCVFTSAIPSFALSYNNFTYETVDDGIVITGYSGSDTSLTIPAEINGASVVKIGDGAFKDNVKLVSVTVSDSIKDIGASAFENCTALADISLPETIIHIGEKAIYNTAYYNDDSNWKLKRSESSGGINIGNGMDSISWEDIAAPLLEYIYLGKNLIEIEYSGSYTVKSGTLVIADGAAVKSVDANELVLPASVVTIGCRAFEGCEKLKNAKNLSYVDYIGDGAFKDCTSLNNIDIAEETLFNASAIYNTGYYNKAVNWKNDVLYMGDRAVGSRENSDEIIIKDGTTQIIGEVLANKNAVIPASVTDIADNAFASAENVTIFGYADTYAQAYANEKGIKFVDLDTLIKGDVNFNGILDENDFQILCSVSALQKHESYAISIAGDMNEDGAVDGLDAIILDLFLKDIGPSTIKGDADGDGDVDRADYDLLVEISLSKEKIKNNYMFNRCDINEDGAVDSFDAMYLDLALNGLVALI